MTDTVEVVRLTHEGRGVAYLGQKILLVENGLPGEMVKIRNICRRRRFNIVQAIEICNPSPDRVNPICPYYHQCGGCSLQHLSSCRQLELKQFMLMEHLRSFGDFEAVPELSSTILGPVCSYRRKARLSVKYVYKKSDLMVGFHEKHRSLVTDVPDCAILESCVGRKLSEIKKVLKSLSIFEYIAQIEFASGDNGAALVFRNLTSLTSEDLKKMRNLCNSLSMQGYLQPGNLESIISFTEEVPLFYRYDDLVFYFKPVNFIQVNRDVNLSLIRQVLEWLEPSSTDRILDLFCGIGNFSLPIARGAQEVWGVEGNIDAVNLARKNAIHNHLDNVKFYVEDLSKGWLPYLIDWKPNKMLLDPARVGAEEICKQIYLVTQLERVVYVSCNSATFARDAGLLCKSGFKLTKIKLADMYPHTAHIEICAVFEK